jgi:hypothetical protein
MATEAPMAATYASCPTTIVGAPFETVWGLLTEPAGWGSFYDVRDVHVDPPGSAVVGQHFRGESGPRILRLCVDFTYTRVDPEEGKLGLEIRLPLGIRVQEEMDCVRLDGDRCRVNYHCNFELPSGWRGAVIRRMLGRELDEGPLDSLLRLKRAAEGIARIPAHRGSRPAAPDGPAGCTRG